MNTEILNENKRQNGLKWAYSFGKITSKNVIVLGRYDSNKIDALKEIDKDFNIISVSLESKNHTSNSDVVFSNADEILGSELYKTILDKKPMVLSDRELWSEKSEEYTKAFAHLTGRSAESLRMHLIDLGVDVKATHLNGKLASIKDVISSVKMAGVLDLASVNIMGELIK